MIHARVQLGGDLMLLKQQWRQIVPVLSLLLLAACSSGEEMAQQGNDESLQKEKIVTVNHNVDNHPAWNDSSAEPTIGESSVEVPMTKKDKKERIQ